MSAVQQAAANTVLRIANLFEQNCALKHGLPQVGGPDRIDAAPEKQEPPPPIVNITNNIPAADNNSGATDQPSPPGLGVVPAVGRSLIRRAAPYLITAATAAGLPVGLWTLFGKDQPPAVVSETDGSLLEWLQDQGQHLPGGWTDGD